MREALDFRRYALPDILSLASTRASKGELAELQEITQDLQFNIRCAHDAFDIARSHTHWVIVASIWTRSPPLHALANSLSEALWSLPIWRAISAQRLEWYPFLEELSAGIGRRDSAAVRELTHERLGVLDEKAYKWLAATPEHERLWE